MTRLVKSAGFTDIHFGKKNNSEQHNQDCLDFIEWFCQELEKDEDIDSIVFGGDWFENRSSLDVKTLNYSYEGAKMLNDLGVPIFFLVGNHDLYQRHTRDIFSTAVFHELANFKVIQKPTVIKKLGDGTLLSPFLFEEEYPALIKHKDLQCWWGHFEFRGFQITGYNMVMQHGPEAAMFEGPDRIFSGHFHKRQVRDNVVYFGNSFPMDFGDAGDAARGMVVYDYIEDKVEFKDWKECPKYVKVSLSDLVDNDLILPEGARVRCGVDFSINFEESNYLKQQYVKKFKLREFSLEESADVGEALSETEVEWEGDAKLASVDEMIVEMLGRIKTEHIDNGLLLKLYREL